MRLRLAAATGFPPLPQSVFDADIAGAAAAAATALDMRLARVVASAGEELAEPGTAMGRDEAHDDDDADGVRQVQLPVTCAGGVVLGAACITVPFVAAWGGHVARST